MQMTVPMATHLKSVKESLLELSGRSRLHAYAVVRGNASTDVLGCLRVLFGMVSSLLLVEKRASRMGGVDQWPGKRALSRSEVSSFTLLAMPVRSERSPAITDSWSEM